MLVERPRLLAGDAAFDPETAPRVAPRTASMDHWFRLERIGCRLIDLDCACVLFSTHDAGPVR